MSLPRPPFWARGRAERIGPVARESVAKTTEAWPVIETWAEGPGGLPGGQALVGLACFLEGCELVIRSLELRGEF